MRSWNATVATADHRGCDARRPRPDARPHGLGAGGDYARRLSRPTDRRVRLNASIDKYEVSNQDAGLINAGGYLKKRSGSIRSSRMAGRYRKKAKALVITGTPPRT
jgi:hypothetical protein